MKYVLEITEGVAERVFPGPSYFTHEDVQYGPGWFTNAGAAAQLGLHPVEDRTDAFEPAIENQTGTEIVKMDGQWIERATVTPRDPAEALRTLKAKRTEDVKAEAMGRILAVAPEWRQRNLTARGVELVRKEAKTGLTPGEAAEADVIDATWALIKRIREASDAHEAALGALATVAEVQAYDITTGWPGEA